MYALPIKACAFPDEINNKIAVAVDRGAGPVFQLDPDIFAIIVGNFDDVSHSGPGLVHLPHIPEPQLVPMHQLHVTVSFSQREVSDRLLVQADVPTHLYVLLGLRLLEPLVVIGL